jgi:sulfotransferase family protein
VTWKRRLNDMLVRTTGYELRSARSAGRARRGVPRGRSTIATAGDRLVTAPAFILCTLRSGSTLLRVLLDSHSQLHAPQELHFRYVEVELTAKWGERAMAELGLDPRTLEYLLWDRILHRELAGSGKRQIVDKTPNNIFIADRLKAAWPNARFVFLLRHPAAIARSRKAVKGEEYDEEKNLGLIKRYCETLESVRQTYEGHTLRYEDLTADPEGETRRLCAFLGVDWEPGMLDYGRFDHGRYRAGLGDWADKIKTGVVQKPEPPPQEIPAALRDACVAWGYLPADAPLAAPAS